MDKMCKASVEKDIKNTKYKSGDSENSKSPVFKFSNQNKTVRGNRLDSSENDIPSYQINQSRTSSKYENETSESVLPFSPIFSPILFPTAQFAPPSIHTVGTVAKLCQSKVNSVKAGGIFESLGMSDKDISWVSSMASPPPKKVPGSEFNTVEKATFFPEEKFQNIQPRALFSPTCDEDSGCHPITFTSESDDDEAYKSNMRLSDVCATLKDLKVRSLETTAEKITQTNNKLSPVIRAKKKKSDNGKQKKKKTLVLSPEKYEFSLGEDLDCERRKSADFIEDDSFQRMSFSGIDELCKTLTAEQSNTTAITDRTLVNISSGPNILKKFYGSKTDSDIHAVSSMEDLHSYAKALEDGDKFVPTGKRLDQSYADKGIVKIDALCKDSSKGDATKRLHSEMAEGKEESIEKKFKKVDDDWEKAKQYLSESQLNVSDGEIFRTLENLEKTLASQEGKETEKLSGEGCQGKTKETTLSTRDIDLFETFEANAKDNSCQGLPILANSFPGFTTASGSKISVSEKSLNKAKELFHDCERNLDDKSDLLEHNLNVIPGEVGTLEKETNKKSWNETSVPEAVNVKFTEGFSTGSGRKIQISEKALEKAKALMKNCDEMGGYRMKTPGKLIQVSVESLEKAKSLMLDAGGKSGFLTGSGKTIQVSSLALEKAKKLMKTCEEGSEDGLTSIWMEELAKDNKKDFEEEPKVKHPIGFSTALGNKVNVSSKAFEKAKKFWSRHEPENAVKVEPPFGEFATAGETSVTASETAILTAKETKMENFNKEETELDSWDEIIPSWLHTYNTSPSMIFDETETSPVLEPNSGEPLKPVEDYIVKSPVLGSNDRFFKNKRNVQLKPEKIVKPSVKRSSISSLDFSAPFKKRKFVIDVKVERARAREEQEKIIKEKEKVKPLKGEHLRRKKEEKQMSWIEAVGGCSPEVHSDELLREFGLCEDVLRINIENAMSFKFDGEQYFGADCVHNAKGIPAGDDCLLIFDDDNQLGLEEISRAFLASPGIQPNLVPQRWLENHYKWIIWKLTHYERSFPQFFGGKCLTPHQVMLQLKYRYDREIDRNERPALRKILERDDTSVKRLVLCVCGIKKITTGKTTGYELILTDGWYSCPGRSDPAMTRLIEERKLCVGTKLVTQGASLVNCEEGVSPLEMRGDVYLKISTNSTRRIRWDTKLGFQRNPENFPVSLSSILPQGGQISRIDVIIVRIYPILFMEKAQDGSHVTRNKKLEEKAEAEFRKIQEQRMEIICSEVQTEMRKAALSKKNLQENLSQLTEASPDTAGSEGERMNLKKFETNQSDGFTRELEKKLEKEKFKKRNVSKFLKAKIVDFRKPDYNNSAYLSVWNPDEDLVSSLSEGKVFSFLNVTVSNFLRAYKPVQINTTRQTQIREKEKIVKYPCRKLTRLNEVSSKISPAFEEVDLVGMVSLIQDVAYGSRLSQVVYLTDLESNFVGILFWGSCKEYGWENVLRIPSVVSCSNLQWKKSCTNQQVPTLYVNETSVFTESPKQEFLKEEMERLKQIIPQDVNGFLSNAEEILTTKLEDSKWRSNDSPSRGVQSSNRSGFESKPTASSTPIKPLNLTNLTNPTNSEEAEPSPIQKRIEKLRSFGEPPSLIPLIIRNNAKRKFKRQT